MLESLKLASPNEITRLLGHLRDGHPDAAERLFALVYPELRRLAANKVRSERKGTSLQPTDLVHEAYLRLIAQRSTDWQSRAHFFALAATIMRRILVDRARRRVLHYKAVLSLTPSGSNGCEPAGPPDDPVRMLALHEAMERLALLDARQCRVVEMRYFGGMGEEEIAAVLQLSARTVKRDWKMARAWLAGELDR